MAKLEYTKAQDDSPKSVERIEVRVWGPGAARQQMFVIGSGANFQGSGTLILEIIYSVNDLQFFYTRNYLHFEGDAEDARNKENDLERFVQGEVDAVGFGDVLPETFIYLKRRRFSYSDENDQETQGESYDLEIGADVGAVVGNSSPGTRMLNLKLEIYKLEEAIQFMRELIHEIIAVHEGKRPNPADLLPGSSDWTFVRQLNQKAYDIISQDYEEDYFSNPVLAEMFNAWLAKFPVGAHILDAGCGHGKPVISRLLEKELRVTGTDLSNKMLERACSQFPNVTFLHQLVSDLEVEGEFDGACSFSSLLYLDPIDLSHSIYRLYRALKPGGWLFLYAYDSHPGSRGKPYDVDLGQWMWNWRYGMQEVTRSLEEFGYFKVMDIKDVTTPQEKEELLASWQKYQREQQEKYASVVPTGVHLPNLKLPEIDIKLAYCYTVLARRAE